MKNDIIEVLIIGAGAAGLMAAIRAAENGKQVTVLEKNHQVGKKLLITGKGRCNITNYCDVRELISNTPVNGKFMTNAFYHFDSYMAVYFFNELGVETKIERGNRVFPTSDKANDVVEALKKRADKVGVKFIYRAVEKINKFGEIFAIKLQDQSVLKAKKLIIATGGKSYPGTGSTGDGYQFAESFGHSITPIIPSLVPISAKYFENKKTLVTDLQGLSLKNAAIKIYDKNNKVVYKDFGEMLFTHFGVTGPMILSASSHLRKIDNQILEIDLKPALDEKKLATRLLREIEQAPRKKVENVLKHLLPKKLIPIIIELAELDADKQIGQITKKERNDLFSKLKKLRIKLEKFRSIKEAIITSGGVNIKEIDPSTMESKLVSNLYFIGEVLDVDAYTGGFNLQVAWSSAIVAADSC